MNHSNDGTNGVGHSHNDQEAAQDRTREVDAAGQPQSIVCNGCIQGLEETSDSVVVSFGDGLWHVDCRCAKCQNLVEHDTNLLLLADGSPVCENCSYVCSSCNLSISNEAIVTGDESYHADCFRCKSCNTRIEELVFAKTTQGIYCMGCHNDRVARTRKHAENKRNKSLRRKDGRSGTSASGISSSRQHGPQSSSSAGPSYSSSSGRQRTPTSHGDSRASPNPASQSISPLPGLASPLPDGPSPGEEKENPAFSSPRDRPVEIDPSPPVSLKQLRAIPDSGSGDSLRRKPSQSRNVQRERSQNEESARPRNAGEHARPTAQNLNSAGSSPSQTTFDFRDIDRERDRDRDRDRDRLGYGHRPSGSMSQTRSSSHSRASSTSTALGPAVPRKQASFDTSQQHARPFSPQLSSSQPLHSQQQDSRNSPVPSSRSNSRQQIELPNAITGTSVSRSPSPHPVLTTSQSNGSNGVERSTSPLSHNSSPTISTFAHAQQQAQSSSFSPPARSLSNEVSSNNNGGLAAPKANKNANRRSGFYGVMAIPAVPSPGSTSPSYDSRSSETATSPLSSSHADPGKEESDYFLVPSASSLAGTSSDNSQRMASNTAEGRQDGIDPDIPVEPVLPLAISRPLQNPSQSTTSSSLSSNLSPNSSQMSSASTSAASLAMSQSNSSVKTGHMSFYDPDVLVFLDAVKDTSDSAAKKSRRASSLLPSDPLDANDTPTGPSAAVQAESKVLASPSASPRLSQYQSRNLNLVANGHLSTISTSTVNTEREGSPIVSPNGIAGAEEEEEQEHLSPISNRTSRNKDGLGLSPSISRSHRRLTTTLSAGDNDDEEDEHFTQDAMKRVRESIRRSRGGSVSRSAVSQDGSAESGMTLDVDLVELLIKELEQTKNRMKELQKNYNAIRRASRQAFEGFSLAREEYDREVAARREAESEMLRLKDQMKDQAARLGALDEIEKKKEMLQRRSNDLRNSVVGIQLELSKMKVERDITVAEMEELAGLPKTEEDAAAAPERLSVLLDTRLKSVREEYRHDLESLTSHRDALKIEIEEYRQARDLFNDETEALNKRNTELADETAEAARKLESIRAEIAAANKSLADVKSQTQAATAQVQSQAQASSATLTLAHKEKALPSRHATPSPSLKSSAGPSSTTAFSSSQPMSQAPSNVSSQKHALPSTPASTVEDQSTAFVAHKVDPVASQATVRKFKWGSKKGLERPLNASISKHPTTQRSLAAQELSARQHNFQVTSILRPVRCEHCGDKMWGIGEQRCQACGIYCHTKCTSSFHIICNSASVIEETPDPNASSFSTMFGNDLVAQCLTENRLVPIVVDTCIEAVEASALEHEGIYRKSGGMGQTKLISACFDRGEPFDLQDQDRFNDISAVTSVLKNYFRNLPNPLYTFEFHQDFCSLPAIIDAESRLSNLESLLHRLPEQHFATLRTLMLHLNRIHRSSKENKMTPANLGVVFGPTLLRSPDPSQEFSQMHLKARVVELTVENAPQLFADAFGTS